MAHYILDVDGVVADFTPHMLARCGSAKTLADVTNWDVFGFLTPEQEVLSRTQLDTREFWSELPVLAGALEGIETIRRAGHHVHWCTSPWVSCVGWEFERRAWLKRHFDAKPDDVFIMRKKEFLRGDVFIDDKAESVATWAAANPQHTAILFDAPYNQHLKWPTRARWFGGNLHTTHTVAGRPYCPPV